MNNKQSGVALLEAVIATLILAIGLLGAIGLQARAYSVLSDAGMRAEATIASDKLIGMMTVDQANLASYAYAGSGTPSSALNAWYTETRSNIPNAAITVTVTPVALTRRTTVNVRIGWTRKTGGQPSWHTVTSYIAQSS
ncbi:hypothetical protein Q4S45_10340 [Massilia sp. R2A-15]|uniref:type IV pilus modification PilV family protein n=1 Tax=Massilia sp. R2A-15 TaxID=3064278 RepID=UPI002735FFB3|nr:prepilin-type N-terminal cleavage/methylation domain-containing protein [Massilia sp. R2A-15]WLI91493.1 hypothetical protein Q4S45_10340 [Massilia sp. R2A-15]